MSKKITPRITSITDKLAYPGMALAFLASASEVEGQIVYTDLEPDVAVSFSTYSVDIDNDGIGELEITRTEFGSMHYVGITHQAAGVSVLGLYYANTMFPKQLQSGDPIAPGDPNWRNEATGFLVSFYSYGQWAFGDPHGFLGVRFRSGADTLYGWIELQMGYNTTYVQGYAYEIRPENAINAGDIGETAGLQALKDGADAITLYPVPAVDQLTIAGLTDAAQVRVLTTTGQVVEAGRSVVPGTTGQVKLDVGALRSGTYLVEIRQADRVTTKTFIKK